MIFQSKKLELLSHGTITDTRVYLLRLIISLELLIALSPPILTIHSITQKSEVLLAQYYFRSQKRFLSIFSQFCPNESKINSIF